MARRQIKLNLKDCSAYLDPKGVLEMEVPAVEFDIHEEIQPVTEKLASAGFSPKEIDDALELFFGHLSDTKFMAWIKSRIVY